MKLPVFLICYIHVSWVKNLHNLDPLAHNSAHRTKAAVPRRSIKPKKVNQMNSKIQKWCSGHKVLTVKIRNQMCFEVLNYKTQESQNINFDHNFLFIWPSGKRLYQQPLKRRWNTFDGIIFEENFTCTMAFVQKTEKLKPLELNTPHFCNWTDQCSMILWHKMAT